LVGAGGDARHQKKDVELSGGMQEGHVEGLVTGFRNVPPDQRRLKESAPKFTIINYHPEKNSFVLPHWEQGNNTQRKGGDGSSINAPT